MSFTPNTSWRALAAGAAAAALLIGAFILGTGQGSTASASAAAASPPGLPGTRITVTGTGNVSGTPDTLTLSMGVQASAASVGSALQQADAAVTAVTAALRGLGVSAPDIQTSGLSIQPTYQSSQAQPAGYGVSESIEVTLNNLGRAGTQISAAVRAGGTRRSSTVSPSTCGTPAGCWPPPGRRPWPTRRSRPRSTPRHSAGRWGRW